MNEKNIRSFSLATLLEANTLRPGDLYYDGCVIASRVDVTDEFNIGLFRYPTRLNAFAIVFCSKGSITFTSGLRHHTLKERTLFVHLPGSILQMESVERESSVYAVMCEEEFIRRINIDFKLLSRLFLCVEEQPCLRLTEEEWNGITRSFAEIDAEGAAPRTDLYSDEVMRTVIRTLAYKVCRVIDHHISAAAVLPASARSRNEEYFNQFMKELARHYMQHRSVGFYAAQLHLTPKYLTTIIRKTTGRTASDWIDDYLPQLSQPVVLRQIFQGAHRPHPDRLPDGEIAVGHLPDVRLINIGHHLHLRQVGGDGEKRRRLEPRGHSLPSSTAG